MVKVKQDMYLRKCLSNEKREHLNLVQQVVTSERGRWIQALLHRSYATWESHLIWVPMFPLAQKGNTDYSVSIRITDNDYKEPRT